MVSLAKEPLYYHTVARVFWDGHFGWHILVSNVRFVSRPLRDTKRVGRARRTLSSAAGKVLLLIHTLHAVWLWWLCARLTRQAVSKINLSLLDIWENWREFRWNLIELGGFKNKMSQRTSSTLIVYLWRLCGTIKNTTLHSPGLNVVNCVLRQIGVAKQFARIVRQQQELSVRRDRKLGWC